MAAVARRADGEGLAALAAGSLAQVLYSTATRCRVRAESSGATIVAQAPAVLLCRCSGRALARGLEDRPLMSCRQPGSPPCSTGCARRGAGRHGGVPHSIPYSETKNKVTATSSSEVCSFQLPSACGLWPAAEANWQIVRNTRWRLVQTVHAAVVLRRYRQDPCGRRGFPLGVTGACTYKEFLGANSYRSSPIRRPDALRMTRTWGNRSFTAARSSSRCCLNVNPSMGHETIRGAADTAAHRRRSAAMPAATGQSAAVQVRW